MSTESAPGKEGRPEEAVPAPEAPAKAADAELKSREYYDQLLRLKAEFENFRKRVEKERPDLVRYGKEEVLGRLLPLYDVLETARTAMKGSDGAPASPADLKALSHGIDMIFKEFGRIFKAEGLAEIESVGKPYHHDRHDVIGTVERPDLPEDTVVEEVQKGFLLDGRVLRHAKVRISKKPAAVQEKP